MVAYKFCYGQDKVATRWGIVKEVLSMGEHLLITVQNWHSGELAVLSEAEIRWVMPLSYSAETPPWLVQSANGAIVHAPHKEKKS